MYWPRLRLTKDEAERWAPYFQPNNLQRAVLYRTYNGELNLNTQIREDSENIQISRRARVIGMTASGDLHNTEIIISDSGGEQYTMGFTPMANLFPGVNSDPRGMASFNPALAALLTQNRLTLGFVFASPFGVAPHIFEPNIVLDPNQTLTIRGRNLIQLLPTQPDDESPASHVSFNLHVWEFPIE